MGSWNSKVVVRSLDMYKSLSWEKYEVELFRDSQADARTRDRVFVVCLL